MKTEYGTGEVILLQTLDYFRKKIEALEGESYRADELDFCYNSLHEDYVKKCAEYNALKTSYDRLENDYANLSTELYQSLNDYKKKIIDLEKENNEYAKDFSELNRKYQALKKEKESATWEWSLLKTEKNDAESRYIDMKNNMEDLVKDYDNLYEENIKLKQALDMRMTECDELKSEIFILKGLIEKSNETTYWGQVDDAKIVNIVCDDNKATTPISSEEADTLAYMAGWEKAGY